jgi:hypothetical protein
VLGITLSSRARVTASVRLVSAEGGHVVLDDGTELDAGTP